MKKRRCILCMAVMCSILMAITPVYAEQVPVSDYAGLSETQRIEIIGKACQEDYQKSGILASISTAQCILESGYMGTELAVKANNCFGMKTTLSGNDWADSAWDGVSVYTKQTQEEYDGQLVTITADFREYDSLEASVADHSAYLLGAKNGNALRYAGLKGETDYRKAASIIKAGGYATDSTYVEKLCKIIEKYDLTRFDKYTGLYRIRTSWGDVDSQIGAYRYLKNAILNCRLGYNVYNEAGEVVYIG